MKRKLSATQWVALALAVIFAGCITLGVISGVFGMLIAGIFGMIASWSLFTHKKKESNVGK